MPVTRVIVNADDFGMSRNISDMIVKGYDCGIITSTTLMATASTTGHAASLAKTRPGLGVGVHLNITAGRPLSDPAKLSGLVDDDGCFLAPGRIARRLVYDFRLVTPIAEEYGRQVETCLDLGITPTHCDTHHGVHRFPVVFEAFKRTLLRYGIKAARSGVALDIQTQRSATLAGADVGYQRDRGLRGAWKSLCARRMHASGIQTPDALLRADERALGQVSPHAWLDFLVRHAPPGTFEIVLHPGMPDENGAASSDYSRIRQRDTALLDRSDRPSERWSGRVRFISYAELACMPAQDAGTRGARTQINRRSS